VRVDQEHRVRGEQVENVRGDVVGYLDRLLALPVPAARVGERRIDWRSCSTWSN